MPTTIHVEGMSCAGCEESVEDALRDVEGVTDATANRDSDQATVEGDAERETLLTAVENAGYETSV